MAADHGSASDPQQLIEALTNENQLLSRRIEREQRIRHKAEEIAEQGLRELYNQQRELEFLSQLTIMANQAGSAREVLASALEYICRFTGWPAAHAYIVGGQGAARRMWPSNIWYSDPGLDLSGLRADTSECVFEEGVGLPGQVWESGKPVWMDDLVTCDYFARKDSALRSGLRSAFSVPVVIGSEVTASLEFFGPNPMPEDSALLSMIAKAGTQLGRVIERDSAKARLHDAMHDPLTGLPSRPYFVREVEQALREYSLDRTAGFCVLYVDLDRFKMVNDSLGHAAGDALITQVGARLKAAINEGEIAVRADATDPPALLARVGGDEFALLVPAIRHPEEALAIADRIQTVLREPFRLEGHEVVTGASIGIALCSPEDGSADELVRHADMAMYHAKARGKARSEVYDRQMQDRATRRMTLHNELRAAVDDDAFTLRYQPVVSLADGKIVGVEALVRWQVSPTVLRYPDEFIPAAEETGLIVPLGSWVLREACRATCRWNAARGGRQSLTISVNLSPRQLAQPGLVEEVRGIIAETGIRPELLSLEITESMTMDDPDYAADVLNRLRELGIRISIDDFGTGFSCLSYLHRLPLQVLKIDRSFIARMETNMESLQIVNTIVVLARSLGLEVIAEGAETAAEVDRLRSMGCNFYQGFHFSAPVSEERLLSLLAAQP
ncbi:MAG: GGDEF domain-containing protein [Mycobacteriaceae bacterium]